MIIGSKDAFKDGVIYGWAYDTEDPPVQLKIVVETEAGPAAEGVADVKRPDLAEAGIGNGDHAFRIALPGHAALPIDKVRVFAMRGDGKRTELLATSSEESQLGNLLRIHAVSVRKRIAELETRLEEVEYAAFHQPRDSDAATEERVAIFDLIHALDNRVSGAEVFLVRIDEALRKLTEEQRPRRGGFWNMFGRR